MGDPELTNKAAYEVRLNDGGLYGQIGPRDFRRFADTLKWLCQAPKSLLDVGCFSGHWLHYVTQRVPSLDRALGIDVAENRIEDAKRRYPELDFRVAYAERLDLPPGSFEVVTCLEVLEHVPDWLRVLEAMHRIASRQVLITVPNRETIIQTPCIHCGKLTPLYGHLRTYTEKSFPQVPGWSLSFGRLRDKDPNLSLARRLYHIVKRRYAWLVVDYRRVA